MMFWSQVFFQDCANWTMYSIKLFHEDVMLLLLFLGLFSLLYFLKLWSMSVVYRSFNHQELLEICYTLFPFLCLMVMGVLSMNLLFSIDESDSGHDLTVKVIGHQWYWSYNYADVENLMFDSYMSSTKVATLGNFLYLETDHHMVVPLDATTRVVSVSEDVLHSWALPSLGIKIDVIPGRLNVISLYNKVSGLFFGQCSEICGVNHAFMPISVEVMPVNVFMAWVKSF